jgi:hypothetical protein
MPVTFSMVVPKWDEGDLAAAIHVSPDLPLHLLFAGGIHHFRVPVPNPETICKAEADRQTIDDDETKDGIVQKVHTRPFAMSIGLSPAFW